MKLLDLRLAYRFHRFEILAFGVLIVLATVGAAFVAANLDATGYGTHCSQFGTGNPAACEAMGRAFYDIQSSQVGPVQAILVVLPFLLGALIGAAVVGREVERGTSRLAWSLAPSRSRWFVVRVLPALGVVFVLAFVAGIALDRLVASTEPWTDPANSFTGFGARGVVLATRATFVFAIGVTVGAIIGRAMPALIVTAVVAYAAIAGGSYVHGKILATEAVLVEETENGPDTSRGALFFDQRIRLADGRVVSWDELMTLYPQPTEGYVDTSNWPPEGSMFLDLVVPGTRYRFVELREVAALSGGSIAALGIGALAVRRRRPG